MNSITSALPQMPDCFVSFCWQIGLAQDEGSSLRETWRQSALQELKSISDSVEGAPIPSFPLPSSPVLSPPSVGESPSPVRPQSVNWTPSMWSRLVTALNNIVNILLGWISSLWSSFIAQWNLFGLIHSKVETDPVGHLREVSPCLQSVPSSSELWSVLKLIRLKVDTDPVDYLTQLGEILPCLKKEELESQTFVWEMVNLSLERIKNNTSSKGEISRATASKIFSTIRDSPVKLELKKKLVQAFLDVKTVNNF